MRTLAILAVLAAAPAHAQGSPLEQLQKELEVHADLFISDVQPVNLALVAGTPLVRGLLLVGAGRANQFTGGLGIGLHLGRQLWFDADANCSLVQALSGAQETDLLWQVRGLIGVQIFERLAFFAGPSANLQLSFAPNPVLRGSYLNPVMLLEPPSGGGGWQFWGGLQVGIRL